MTRPGLVGLSFKETMSGWFSMGERDPLQGAEHGRMQRSKMTLNLTVRIDNMDRFLCDTQHTGMVRGEVVLPGVFSEPAAASGVVRLFEPYYLTQRKSFTYDLTFMHRNQRYRLFGEKILEDDPGFDLWRDTSTLYTRLERQNGGNTVVGAGMLNITVWGFVKELFSLRPSHATSFRESFQSVATFMTFFASELWDVYVRRTKGFFLKYAIVTSVILGGFYVIHAWSIEAASGMTFMAKLRTVSFSDWYPGYWPGSLRALLGTYQEVYRRTPGILIFPLVLLIGLNMCRRDDGVHSFLGLGNFQFYPDLITRLRGTIHACTQMLLNLLLIWAFVKLNSNLFNAPLNSASESLAFLVEMVLIGGTSSGLLYSLFRGVKLIRPYAG